MVFVIKRTYLDQYSFSYLELIVGKLLRVFTYYRASVRQSAKNAAMIFIGDGRNAAGIHGVLLICGKIRVRCDLTH